MFDGKYKELFKGIKSKDPLKFVDTKKYSDRIKSAQKQNLEEAVRVAYGNSSGKNYCCLYGFQFYWWIDGLCCR